MFKFKNSYITPYVFGDNLSLNLFTVGEGEGDNSFDNFVTSNIALQEVIPVMPFLPIDKLMRCSRIGSIFILFSFAKS